MTYPFGMEEDMSQLIFALCFGGFVALATYEYRKHKKEKRSARINGSITQLHKEIDRHREQ